MFALNHLALLIPFGWFAAALFIHLCSLKHTFKITRFMSFSGLAIALSMLVLLFVNGSSTSALIGWNEIGFSARIDALSVTILSLVSFIAVIVLRYSENYLDGEPRQISFMKHMCLTLACTTLLVMSGNIVQLVVAWIGTSLALNQLLVFYKERKGAVMAAKKKWITARIGDTFLIAAAVLIFNFYGTTDLAFIMEMATSLNIVPFSIQLACGFIALAALLKSAQFPTHGWLLEVMETPTPVSALLHAGIINAGGFLILRFADLMVLFPTSLHVVAIVGGFTALFAGFVMLTQPAFKTSLAWSTIAQMGFMMLQCGLGAFSIAVLHLVAHSLYKAHAFLSSGSIIDVARSLNIPKTGIQNTQLRLLISLVLSLAVYLTTSYLVFEEHMLSPVNLTLGMILVMGATHLILNTLEESLSLYSTLRSVTTVVGIALIFNLLHFGTLKIYGGLFPEIAQADMWDYVVMTLTLTSFSIVMFLQIRAPQWLQQKQWSPIYVHLFNGFYLNTVFDRLVGTYQISNSQKQN